MPCHLTVYDPQSKARHEYDCDEQNTARAVEDDHAAKGSGEYTDLSGNAFTVDWTSARLIGFVRKSEDGGVIRSGDADGCQSPVS